MDYKEFIENKRIKIANSGFELEKNMLNKNLFNFQKEIVQRALRKGKCAIFSECGTGKTLMQLEWANQVVKYTKKPVLILCPLAVAQQTIEEHKKFDIETPIEKIDPTKEIENKIYITNYEQLENINSNKFEGVILDECFAPDTKIQIVRGKKLYNVNIKDCKIGDYVINCTGIDKITAVKRKKVEYAIKIGFNGKTVICSPRHPFFTKRGWVSAKEIQKDDFIIATDKAMRILRGDVYDNIQGGFSEKILQQILFSEMADEPARTQSESAHERGARENRKKEINVVQNTSGTERTRENTQPQSDEQSRNKKESIIETQRNGAPTFGAWGKWTRDDITTAINEGCIVRHLDCGISYITGQKTKGLSDKLQSRFSELEAKNCDRARWTLSSLEKRARQEEGRKTGYFGVESFEVLELGCAELDKYRDEKGQLYFYDLTIEQHPSFTINECLVHNSSILKNFAGKTKELIVELFNFTPYKLACTATPSPNDEIELGNHSEFLNVMKSTDMVAKFFTTDKDRINGNKYRIKKHAINDFYRWIKSWAIVCTKPSDVGNFSDENYKLPELEIKEIKIETKKKDNGLLFNDISVSATTFNEELRRTMEDRLDKAIELVKSNPDESFIIWIKQNAEGEYLSKMLPEAIEVKGSDKTEDKERNLLNFAKNKFRILITKAKIAQYGLNFQNCHNQIFASLDFSFEGTYQAIRRSYRFGQKEKVKVWMISTDTMGNVIQSINEKQEKFVNMREGIIKVNEVMNHEELEEMQEPYISKNFKLYNGDCVELIKNIEEESIDYSFFSPPFGAMYVFSNDPQDMSNVKNDDEFYEHFKYLIPELYRVLKPGRLVSLHLMQGTTLKGRDGHFSIKDFRGDIIRLFQQCGFYFHAETMIRKDPKTAAIRTKNHQLMHGTTKKDSSIVRSGLADYLITFRKPGENQVPIVNNIPFDLWCKMAEPVWLEINESDTLPTQKDIRDERHITATQLTPIKWLYEMYCNKGETVLSPFSGIGSEGYVAVKNNRKYIGFELKPSYFKQSIDNLIAAQSEQGQQKLTLGV